MVAVDGAWSSWGSWSACSNNKDGKTQCAKLRYRYCNNPAKSNGGKDCEGFSAEKYFCKATDMSDASKHPSCVITGGWSTWGTGSKCNSDCKTTKARACNNPAPFNSKDCEGSKTETAVCTGGDCSASKGSGSIKSPNYPSNYPNSKDVQYPIKVEAGSKIELTFVDFAIEDNSQCGYDYVQVIDTDGKQLIQKCGSTKPSVVVSKGNTMTVKFHSDNDINAKGFSATWKKISTSESGTITSPNYPKSYSGNVDKTYDLAVAEGSKVEITFTDVEIEKETNCSYDYVEVFNTDMKSMGKYCGAGNIAAITSSGKSMKVKFHSDYSTNAKGFSATWKKV